MELARQMTPASLPPIIQRKCNEFVSTFNENRVVELSRRIIHNGVWKESEHQLAEVTNRILDTLQDAWNNPAFSPEFAGFQSEGTYVNNIVLPTIRTTLKDLPLEKSTFVSSSEKQSSASADRRGEGRSDDSGLVHQLSATLRYFFMELARQMTPASLPPIIQRKCNEFVSTFNENRVVELSRRIIHNGVWKESEHQLAEVTNRILDTLQDAWNNPAFSPEFAGFQSEGTYVNNIVLPTIRTTLKDLPLEKSTFVSSSEKQSSASADRRGEGRSDDEVKLWCECNDGLYWVHKSCTPNRDQFDIVEVQIAGSTIRLNVLIRDLADIHRYYHIRDVEIPVQQSNSTIVTKFVETLLIMRNILLVNISLLCNAPLTRSNKIMEKSSTISSPIRENN
ncbi:hypothetical protein Glove_202g106 [Diversispora epigaea]|uniref:Uncharacterized protein n=1 Tax=Diversispora epigaea TaxID=1348612 RepID=A0A397ITD7_9GLOM|nr:hypothetical protein Glove_202g106 [Diversispora epigaea]